MFNAMETDNNELRGILNKVSRHGGNDTLAVDKRVVRLSRSRAASAFISWSGSLAGCHFECTALNITDTVEDRDMAIVSSQPLSCLAVSALVSVLETMGFVVKDIANIAHKDAAHMVAIENMHLNVDVMRVSVPNCMLEQYKSIKDAASNVPAFPYRVRNIHIKSLLPIERKMSIVADIVAGENTVDEWYEVRGNDLKMIVLVNKFNVYIITEFGLNIVEPSLRGLDKELKRKIIIALEGLEENPQIRETAPTFAM